MLYTLSATFNFVPVVVGVDVGLGVGVSVGRRKCGFGCRVRARLHAGVRIRECQGGGVVISNVLVQHTNAHIWS